MSAELLVTPQGVAAARAALEALDTRLAACMSSPVVMPVERPKLIPPRLEDLVGSHRTRVVDVTERREREMLVQALVEAEVEDKPGGGEAYSFSAIFPVGHFVGDYVTYWGHCTDAPREYHEVCALVLLAMATSDVRFDFPFEPGLRTNLYVLLIGETTRSKKSSAKNIARDIARRVWNPPGGVDVCLPDRSTPEGLARNLAERSGRPSLWAVDEIGPELGEMHTREHMKAKEELLLQLYGQSDYEYSRSKESVQIVGSHLNVLACAADSIFESLSTDQIRSGLLPRFAVVPLESFPPPLSAFEAQARQDNMKRDALVDRLKRLSRGPQADGKDNMRSVSFASEAKEAYHTFELQFMEAMKREALNKEMFARLKIMGIKVAILAAVGGGHEAADKVLVGEADMWRALRVIDRWMGFARAFTQRIGENSFERHVSRVLTWMYSHGGRVRRSEVAQGLHLRAAELNELEKTLCAREEIEVMWGPKPKRGPQQCFWVRCEQKPDEEKP